MFLHVTKAEALGGYRLRLTFNEGTVGEVDLTSELEGEIFEPLKDPEQFKKFRVDPEMETLAWENGADLAPEYLYELAKGMG